MSDENQPENIDARLKGIESAIRGNMSLSSVPLLMEAIKSHPDHPQVNYLLALSYYKNRNLEKAMAYILRAVELKEDDDDYLTLLAKLLLENNRSAEAGEKAEAAFAINPQNWEAALILAKMAFNQNSPSKALELVEQVLKYNPRSFDGHRLKTKIYIQQEEPLEKILQSIEDSEKFGYDDDIAYDKVYAYYIHNQFGECRNIYKDLLRTRPLANSTQKVGKLIESMQSRRQARKIPHNALFDLETVGASPKKPKVTLEESLNELKQLIGLDGVKDTINRIVKLVEYDKKRAYMLSIENSEQPSYHFAFYGNPGTGKTTVARILGNIFYSLGILETGQLVEVDRSDLVGGYVGQTAQKTKAVIESAMGGVLFIDEAYSLVSGDSDSADYGSEAIDILIKAMEDYRNDFIVILAGYDTGMKQLLKSNPGLSSRINMQIYFDDFSDLELLEIAKGQAKDNYYTLTAEAEKAFMIKINQEKVLPHFANARAVRNIMETAMRERAFRLSDQPITKEDLLIIGAARFRHQSRSAVRGRYRRFDGAAAPSGRAGGRQKAGELHPELCPRRKAARGTGASDE